MKITENEVKHLANLARLKFTDNEITEYTTKLEEIVKFTDSLSEVNIDGVEPTNHIVKSQNVFRKDEVKPSFDRNLLFSNAPTKVAGCISVPRVVE